MAAVFPRTKFRLPGLGSREFSFNPGPFNIKEHVLITIFASAGWAFGGGSAYAVAIVGPALVWLLHKAFPNQSWIPLINLPVILGATAAMPPATAVNYNMWILVGTIFNFFVFRYRKQWWQRYNYVLSAGLDAGVAFMGVLIYFTLTMENKSLTWWGTGGEHCPLASCPTAKGIVVDGCPVYS